MIEDRLFCQEMYVLAKTSYLGHYLLDAAFVDTVNDAIAQCTEEQMSRRLTFPSCHGPDFYEGVPQGSSTRLLVADLTAWTSSVGAIARLQKGPLDGQSKEAHADFTMDVLQAVAQRFMASPKSTSPLEVWKTSCKHHSHGDDKPCYREKGKEYVATSHTMTWADRYAAAPHLRKSALCRTIARLRLTNDALEVVRER
jgi:hypothetical protein